MQRNKKKEKDIGDDMLDRDGVIVEPDVRKSISKYFKKMGMRETTYPIRATFFANPNEDPQKELKSSDDPVGLKQLARKEKMEREVRGESLVRKAVREMIIGEGSQPHPSLGIITFKSSPFSNITIIYSIPALDWTLSRLFGTRVPKPDPDDLVVSGVEWGKPGAALETGEKGDGPCNLAYVVRRSVTSFPGWGRKAYIAAIDSAGELGADRGDVESPAEKAWKSIAGGLEAHPYDNIEKPVTPSPDDDCKIHHGRPVLNASYSINGSTPSDISSMLQAGSRHFDILQKHGGEEIVKKAKMVLKIEFDTIFREKYKRD